MSLGTKLSASIAALIFSVVPLFSAHAISPASTSLDQSRSTTEDVSQQPSPPLVIASFLEDERRPIGRNPLTPEGHEKKSTSWALYIDNDLFALTSKDRDYTGGVALTLSGKEATTYAVSLDPLLHKINNNIGINSTQNTLNPPTLHSFEFGIHTFTPNDTSNRDIVTTDRPYASLAYVANSRQQINRKRRSSIITNLSIGALGLNLGETIQKAIHELSSSDPVRGWKHQISDGGELTARYFVARQKMRYAHYLDANNNYEIKTATRASLGYLTELSWGLSGRWGRIRSPWWSFNPQVSSYADKSAPMANSENTATKKELYFWAGSNIHLRLYNAFLRGQFRNSALTYKDSELERVIVESWAGITMELSHQFRASYFLRGHTKEIKQGEGARNQLWGGLIVSRTL